jgi:hypothetical protein
MNPTLRTLPIAYPGPGVSPILVYEDQGHVRLNPSNRRTYE